MVELVIVDSVLSLVGRALCGVESEEERSKGIILRMATSEGLVLCLRRRHSEKEPSPDLETSNWDRRRVAKAGKETT